MKKISLLETTQATRFDESDPNKEGNKNTKFADLIIDGKSLYQMFKKYDMVPSLGWGTDEYQRLLIKYFLLERPHENMWYRYPVLVCPWCGDEGCGFISVKVDREENVIIWKDFILEGENKKLNRGPFYFQLDNYEKVIKSTFRTAGVQ